MKFEQQNNKHTDTGGGELWSLWVWLTDGWSTGSTGRIFPLSPLSHPSPTAKIYQTPRGSPQRTVVEQKSGVQHFSTFFLFAISCWNGHNGLVLQIVADPIIHSAATSPDVPKLSRTCGRNLSNFNEMKPVPLFLAAGRLMENIRQN